MQPARHAQHSLGYHGAPMYRPTMLDRLINFFMTVEQIGINIISLRL